MLKSCEAFFVYTHLNMANLIPFTKRFESSENLVDLLESRGLQICDRNKAIQYLDNIGYYRLSAYMYPLLKMPKTAHLYKESSTFKKVMMLYRFDKKLRLLMFNEIENYLCNNRIRHASHLNSEPGRVFCFYGNIKIIH